MRFRLSLGVAAVAAALFLWPFPIHGQRFPTRSTDLESWQGDRVRVIVQATDSGLRSLAQRYPRSLKRQVLGAAAMELSKAEFESLSRDGSVSHISKDLPVVADMAITNQVTGAESVWHAVTGLLGVGGTSGFKGTGIGVAVLDSGIAPHSALGDRVSGRVNFVSSEPGVTGDPFGHGTHVAGMIGGSGSAAVGVTTAYSGGSAPAVRFVDVRVLGATGVGYTSDVIAGIDWVIANRAKYGIRIINLSVGHPVAESATTDPLCLAAERAVRAGIVVVASAGNFGQTSSGAPILGGITSPGNSPAVITVGAVDTAGTVDRSDDKIASYSSRGPTQYDGALKPDVVAPGTRIVSLEAAKSYLATTYPQWHVAGKSTNGYFRLTGTSMATAVVSGGVALLLDAHPALTPAQVKVALQSGAEFIGSGGLIAGGTGSVDFAQSLKITDEATEGLLSTTIGNLLGRSSGASFLDTGILISRMYDRTGTRLVGLSALDTLFSDADRAEPGVLTILGKSNGIARIPANYLVWGNIADWTSGYYLVWGTTIQDPSGQYLVWGTSELDYLVWGTTSVALNSQR